MADHNSTAKQIAAEVGCSVATVNNKAKVIGIKLKGRSPEDHGRLMEALKSVKPRKRKAATKKKATRKKKAAAPSFAGDVASFLTQGKSFIPELRKRIAALDKEKTELEGSLEKLLTLYPEKRK